MATDPATSPPSSDSVSPRWLSHHDPDHLDRCCRVGGHHVCRRCLALYPLAAAAAVAVALWPPPAPLAAAVVWVLPVPFVADWVLEHLGRVRHSPTRQVAVTLLAAPALGVVLGLHARDPFAALAVAPALVWGGVCLATAWFARRRPDGRTDWEQLHEQEEAERRARLQRLLAETDRRSDARPGSS